MTTNDLPYRAPKPILRLHHLPESFVEISGLGIAPGRPIVVLVGGAGGVQKHQLSIIKNASSELAKIADDLGVVIIDGGTDSGIMASIGQARKEGNHNFPLIGVAVEALVTPPQEGKYVGTGGSNQHSLVPLESNHSAFVLVPGHDWGDESPYLARIGTLLADGGPSITVLVNGGTIAHDDVANGFAEGRPVLVFSGTGRYADELASSPPDSALYNFVDAKDGRQIRKILLKFLGDR